MLKKILSPSTCAACRFCCVFGHDDIWEIPIFSKELSEKISVEHPELVFIKRGESNYVFDMKFDKDGLTYCPALSDKGCILGDKKPFDCQIWPLRAMKKGDDIVITVSPVCKAIDSSKPEVAELVKELSQMIFEEADQNPDLVKDYIEGYPIFAVKARQ